MSQDSVFGSVTGWVRDLEAGNVQALDALCHRYFDKISRLADFQLFCRSGSIDDGEDVALEVLLRLSKNARREENRGKIRDRETLWLFLLAITHSIAADLKRREQAIKRGGGNVLSLSDVDVSQEYSFSLLKFIDESSDHESTTSLRDSVEYLLFKKLKVELTREVARLKLEGYTNQEVADALNLDVSSVRRKLKRIQGLWLDELGLSNRGDEDVSDSIE